MHATRSRCPALPAAACFAAGILLDTWLTLPLAVWWSAVVGTIVAWAVPFTGRYDRAAAGVLLAGVLVAGGLAHHVTSRVTAPDDISLFAAEERRLVRVRAVLATAPEFRAGRRPHWNQQGHSQCTLDCRAFVEDGRAVNVSGRLRLRVAGDLNARLGDVVEIVGWLARPAPPLNPGDFDYERYLRQQGMRATLSAEAPAVTVIGQDRGRWFSGGVDRLRTRCGAAFEQHLGPRTRPVALALMLGDRTSISDQLNQSFAESGLLHVLAISGQHVAILALLLWGVCRWWNLSPAATTFVLLAGVLGYSTITHVRPPIVRAAVFIALVTLGRPWHRHPASANLWALAALVVLAWRPTDLFDSGTQLSFLAVAGILFWHNAWGSRFAETARRALSAEGQPAPRRWAAWSWNWLCAAYGLTGCVWLLAMPLIAGQFHIVSAVGLMLNVLLSPLIVMTLWVGYLFVAAALAAPLLAGLLGGVFDLLLLAFLAPVEWAAGVGMGHRYVAGPPGWWLVGFYALAAAVMGVSRRWAGRRVSLLALMLWTIVGLAAGLRPSQPAGLRCTFVAVGHGGAVLVEFPSGRTLLYDAGALDDPGRAAQAVRNCLWSRGRDGLDAIVISHADLDHFNAVPELVASVPVDRVFAARSFLHLDQPEVAAACEAIAAAGVPLEIIGRDDRLAVDSAAAVTVLQPDFDQQFSSDNASSIVLLIEFAGRRILLPGDLEDDGLDHLLAGPPLDVDVLLAPHHGSLNANRPDLAAWAAPEHVVVSRGHFAGLPRLRDIYGERGAVYSTAEQGATTCEISLDGELHVSCWRPAAGTVPGENRN